MKRYGLLGAKLSHSYSSLIHNSVFNKRGIDASYELIECEKQDLEKYVSYLKEGIYSGFNVTIPYKIEIMKYLDEIEATALAIGSVNTIFVRDGKVIGTNTDYYGFLMTLKKYKVEVKNKKCFILGTGGASLAIKKALEDLGGRCIYVSRNPKTDMIGYKDLAEIDIDIMVNTTPVGMYPKVLESPVSMDIAKKAKVVIDIIFNPLQTKLLKDASSTINGLYMLVMQAVKAEEYWLQQPIELDADKIYAELLTRLK